MRSLESAVCAIVSGLRGIQPERRFVRTRLPWRDIHAESDRRWLTITVIGKVAIAHVAGYWLMIVARRTRDGRSLSNSGMPLFG